MEQIVERLIPYVFFQTGDSGAGSAALVFFDASITVSETVTTPVMLCVQLDLTPGTISLGCDMTVTLGVSDGTAGTYTRHS